jgi:hypothetical protein
VHFWSIGRGFLNRHLREVLKDVQCWERGVPRRAEEGAAGVKAWRQEQEAVGNNGKSEVIQWKTLTVKRFEESLKSWSRRVAQVKVIKRVDQWAGWCLQECLAGLGAGGSCL